MDVHTHTETFKPMYTHTYDMHGEITIRTYNKNVYNNPKTNANKHKCIKATHTTIQTQNDRFLVICLHVCMSIYTLMHVCIDICI